MIKYICIILCIVLVNCTLYASIQDSVNYDQIDMEYSGMSLEQKLRSIIIPKEGFVLDGKDSGEISWVGFENLYELSGVNSPFLSDVMIRSALLNGDNEEILKQASNVLIKNKKDGFFVTMKSPYALMFQNKNERPSDFFLEPFGKVALPYVDYKDQLNCFVANTYRIPSEVLAPYAINQRMLTENTYAYGQEYISGLGWNDLQDVLKHYENPSLEFILSLGGFLYSDHLTVDISSLKRVFDDRLLSEDILEKSCKKMLLCKQLLHHKPKVSNYQAKENDVNIFLRSLYKEGMVLLENENIIPLQGLAERKIASVHIGVNGISLFQETLAKYVPCDHFILDKIPNQEQLLKLRDDIKGYNTIIIGVNGDWYDDDLNHSLYSFLHQVSNNAELILVHFGSGNRLAHLPKGHPFKAILLSFPVDNNAQEIAAQIIFGGIGAKGVLAKNINSHFSFGTRFFTQKSRLGYSLEYEKAMQDTLSVIDQVVYKAIRERAMPGCQVLVAKGGDVIYNKAFGYHTYNKKRHVKTSDLYDIASVTKIVSSVPSVMKMVDEGKLLLIDSLSYFLPRLENTNKSKVTISDMLIHQAGLVSWIPFYMRTIDKDKLKGDIFQKKYSSIYNLKLDKKVYLNKTVRYRTNVFRHTKTDMFNIKVSDKWFMNHQYIDSIKMGIDTSKVELNPEYKYSDLGYYYIKEIVEKTYRKELDLCVQDYFYKPLGAFRTLYKPLDKFSKKEIVPTENDRAWRHQLVHGFVHDPGAAMLGGVGGHAGVFSNAEDLVKMLQMYLNNGSYGGVRYIDSTTISKFTSVVKEGNRRGIGFDKPVLDPEISGPCCSEASPSSYGHSGFTGTLVWVDPEYDLIYIFLSNRIHPNQYNKKLITDNVRTDIQSAIYRSLPEYWEKKVLLNKNGQ